MITAKKAVRWHDYCKKKKKKSSTCGLRKLSPQTRRLLLKNPGKTRGKELNDVPERRTLEQSPPPVTSQAPTGTQFA